MFCSDLRVYADETLVDSYKEKNSFYRAKDPSKPNPHTNLRIFCIFIKTLFCFPHWGRWPVLKPLGISSQCRQTWHTHIDTHTLEKCLLCLRSLSWGNCVDSTWYLITTCYQTCTCCWTCKNLLHHTHRTCSPFQCVCLCARAPARAVKSVISRDMWASVDPPSLDPGCLLI